MRTHQLTLFALSLFLPVACSSGGRDLPCATASCPLEDLGGPPGGDLGMGAKPFSYRLNATGESDIRSVATDRAGNIYAGGTFKGEVDFGDGKKKSGTGVRSGFVLKLSSAGKLLWSRQLGGADTQIINAIAVGPDGELVAAGSCGADVDLGGGDLVPCPSQYAALVVRYDASGKFRWGRPYGADPTNGTLVHGVSVDANGDAVMVGEYSADVDFGGGKLKRYGSSDVFVVRLNRDGGHVWSRGLGGPGPDALNVVAMDGTGAVYVGGWFSGTADLGAAMPTALGNLDGFVLKLDSQGTPLWTHVLGGTGGDGVNRLALAKSGGVWVDGSCVGTIDLGKGPQTCVGYTPGRRNDSFLVQLGNDGVLKSGQILQAIDAYALAIGPSGQGLVAGAFEGTVSIGGGKLTSAGAADIPVLGFAADGSVTSTLRLGGSGTEAASTAAFLPTGEPLLAGTYTGDTDLGDGATKGYAYADGFLVLLRADGSGKIPALLSGYNSAAAVPIRPLVTSRNP